MDLLEYKAQEIFAKYGVPTMKNTVIDSADGIADKIKEADLTYPVVVKAQVQIGGRGKAGGVKFADNAEEDYVFEDKLKELNAELEKLNNEAHTLETTIALNVKALLGA